MGCGTSADSAVAAAPQEKEQVNHSNNTPQPVSPLVPNPSASIVPNSSTGSNRGKHVAREDNAGLFNPSSPNGQNPNLSYDRSIDINGISNNKPKPKKEVDLFGSGDSIEVYTKTSTKFSPRKSESAYVKMRAQDGESMTVDFFGNPVVADENVDPALDSSIPSSSSSSASSSASSSSSSSSSQQGPSRSLSKQKEGSRPNSSRWEPYNSFRGKPSPTNTNTLVDTHWRNIRSDSPASDRSPSNRSRVSDKAHDLFGTGQAVANPAYVRVSKKGIDLFGNQEDMTPRGSRHSRPTFSRASSNASSGRGSPHGRMPRGESRHKQIKVNTNASLSRTSSGTTASPKSPSIMSPYTAAFAANNSPDGRTSNASLDLFGAGDTSAGIDQLIYHNRTSRASRANSDRSEPIPDLFASGTY